MDINFIIMHRIFVLSAALILIVPALAWGVKAPYPEWKVSDNNISMMKKARDFARQKKWKSAQKYARKTNIKLASQMFAWWQYMSDTKNSSFPEASAFIYQHLHWPYQLSMKIRAEQSLDDSIDADEIKAWFSTAHIRGGTINFDSPVTPKGKEMLAQALLQNKDEAKRYRSKIIRMLRESWVERDFNKKEEGKFLKKYKEFITEQDYINRINRLLWDGEIKAAKRIVSKVGKDYQALFNARIKLKSNDYGVDKAIKSIPKNLLNDEGLIYDRIKWREKHGKNSKIEELLRELPGKLHYPAKWWQIRERYIHKLIRQKDYKTAYVFSSQHGFTDSNMQELASAEWLAGWIALRFHNRPKEAYRHFYQLYKKVRTPISRGRAAYWAGRSAETNGNSEIAHKWYVVAAKYPTSFYGQMATEKIGEKLLFIPRHPSPLEMDEVNYKNSELVKVAYLFHLIGEHRFASEFLRQAIRQSGTTGERYLIAHLGLKLGRPDYSIVAAKESAKMYGNIFPRALYPTLKSMKDTRGNIIRKPEAALIHAIIMQESIFNSTARSPAGALGLMQLMPATAREVAGKEKYRYNKKRLTSSSAYNVTLGSAYLESMIGQHDGSYILAIAAYNGGPGNVRKWVKANGDPRKMKDIEDVVDWLELIPFNETRNYVQRVLEHLQLYRMILYENAEPYARTAQDLRR